MVSVRSIWRITSTRRTMLSCNNLSIPWTHRLFPSRAVYQQNWDKWHYCTSTNRTRLYWRTTRRWWWKLVAAGEDVSLEALGYLEVIAISIYPWHHIVVRLVCYVSPAAESDMFALSCHMCSSYTCSVSRCVERSGYATRIVSSIHALPGIVRCHNWQVAERLSIITNNPPSTCEKAKQRLQPTTESSVACTRTTKGHSWHAPQPGVSRRNATVSRLVCHI